jgi:hypothetical protein
VSGRYRNRAMILQTLKKNVFEFKCMGIDDSVGMSNGKIFELLQAKAVCRTTQKIMI